MPPPATYSATHKLVDRTKYSDIGFGIGTRMEPIILPATHKKSPMFVSIPERKLFGTPGPGQYRIPSRFDSYQGMDIIARKLIKKLSQSATR